jgi:leucyl aminopeptidase
MGQHIGYGVNQARYWCDLPAQQLTPVLLAQEAEGIAQAHDNLSCRVFDESEIENLGMGGMMAVSKGSDKPPRFVVMEYTSGKEDASTVALVGKGVTFDSGGLSLKPAYAMEEMKDDMAGGASVIATMQTIAQTRPDVNVVACVPITENVINGFAMKPGDIIQFYNGKTAEVKNTDAEGRLILADALAYAAANYSYDMIIDTATLTGSAAFALGPFYGGLMTEHQDMALRLLDAGRSSGDRLWQLPFHDDYKSAVISDVADIANVGKSKYRAGAMTAGLFLQHFLDDRPWVHLDVAGVSFNVPDRSYYRSGATGFGVRLFTEAFMNW